MKKRKPKNIPVVIMKVPEQSFKHMVKVLESLTGDRVPIHNHPPTGGECPTGCSARKGT